MTLSMLRWTAWIVFLSISVVRPGVDELDRRLVARCWNIPSEWNAIADAAMRTHVVDSNIAGVRAPWRQASVLQVGPERVAVVTVSDMRTSRATFLTERYEVLGTFERTTTNPALVTDETRGYKPLTHIWPLIEEQNRVLTLVALAPLLSDPPTMGVFAYLAVGQRDTEVLFVCRLRWGPSSMHGLLDRTDLNGDGLGDLVLYPRGRRDASPIATFQWEPATREYKATLTVEARPLVSWWSTTERNRVTVQRGQSIDDAVAAVAAGFGSDSPVSPAKQSP